MAAPPKPLASVEGLTEYRLDNGLRIVLFPDTSKPTFTLNVTYLVGSRHEGYGESGMAHLLEHMLFKGTPTHTNIMGLIDGRGGMVNGSTSFDRTNYFEVLPASGDNLQFAVELEADRMVNCKVQKSDLDKEFSVVRNEFEMGENNARNVLEERMLATAFLWHNYGKATIGSRVDIERVPIDRLREFYRRYYQPDNAMVVLAGKFDPAAALDLLVTHFGKIPKPTRILPATYTVEPVQDGERLVTLRRNGDVQLVGLTYHGLAGADKGFAAEQAAADILTNAPSGRLYQALVATGLAAKVESQADPTTDPGAVIFVAEVRKDRSVDEVRKKMQEVVEGLAQTPITDEELTRYRTKAAASFELFMNDSMKIGIVLSEYAAIGDWRLGFVMRDRTQALTADAVRQFAANYFKSANRTVGLFIPDKSPVRAPLPSVPDVEAQVRDYKGQAVVAGGEVFEATPENLDRRTEQYVLPNGLAVALLQKKTRGSSVELVLVIRSGDERTLQGKVTAARLIAAMTARGTTTRSYAQLKDELDRQKAELRLEEEAEADGSAYRLSTTRPHLVAVLALLAEMVRRPSFKATEFEALRTELLAKLEETETNPQALAMVEMTRRVHPYPDTDVRYTPTVKEQIERLRAVKLADVVELHRRLWGGAGGQLALVGDFDAAEIKKAISDNFLLFVSPQPYVRLVNRYAPTPPAEVVIDTPDKDMSLVSLGLQLQLSQNDADFPALELANFVLGGGSKSRLFERLRQKEGISYATQSALGAGSLDRVGELLAFAMCAPHNAQRTRRLMLEELTRLVKEGVPASELAAAKRALAGELDNRLAFDEYVANELVNNLEANRTFAFHKKAAAAIQALDAATVKKALARHLDLGHLITLEVGDQKKAGSKKPHVAKPPRQPG